MVGTLAWFSVFFTLWVVTFVQGNGGETNIGDFTPEAKADLITDLPGLSRKSKRRMFSGYIPVEGQGRSLFYWLIESDLGFSNAPLMLWTNGGPGCSGFLGLLTEQGPFRPNKFGTLVENEFSWIKETSMVFIEQPVGVGFSKTSSVAKEVYNDEMAAQDNYRFIINFFKRFPELRTNDFSISSESYGGHYMPTLAYKIVTKGGVPNFKGLFVGNPLISGPLRDLGEFMTFAGHQLLPHGLFMEFHKANCSHKIYSSTCQRFIAESRSLVNGLDPYALDFPKCKRVKGKNEKLMLLSKLNVIERVMVEDLPQPQIVGKMVDNDEGIVQAEKSLRNRRLQYFPSNYEECEESYTTSWLNRPDVGTALHVSPKTNIWAGCNDFINIAYNQTDVQASMIPYYEFLMQKKGLKVWIYSGDDDSVCPTASDQYWIWKYSVSSKWQPWTAFDQVAGFVTHFKGFTYYTVHGAGHMVPSTRPGLSLELLKRFLRA